MKKLTDFFYFALDVLLGALLSGMALMVFANVILRYIFNSGLPVSDELSRYFFVWLTFIGAVVAHRHHMHMGMETFVAVFSRRGRLIFMGVSDLVIIGCSAILFAGTWKQLPINMSMTAPVTGIPMGLVYGIGLFTSTGIILITLGQLYRLVTGRLTSEELARFVGEFHNVDELGDHTS